MRVRDRELRADPGAEGVAAFVRLVRRGRHGRKGARLMRLWHVSPNAMAAGTMLNGYAVDAGFLYMVEQALRNGKAFLETLLQADVLVAAKTNTQAILTNFVIEAVFEEVRRSEFAARPSRLGSVHTFRTFDAAKGFNVGFRTGSGRIYEVQVDEGTPFGTFMDWLNPGIRFREPISPQIEDMRERARSYWRGDAPSTPEYPEAIVAGKVLIAREVT